MTDFPFKELAGGGVAVVALCLVVWKAIEKLGERLEQVGKDIKEAVGETKGAIEKIDSLMDRMVERLARIDVRTSYVEQEIVTQVIPTDRSRRMRTRTPVQTPFTGGDTPPKGEKP